MRTLSYEEQMYEEGVARLAGVEDEIEKCYRRLTRLHTRAARLTVELDTLSDRINASRIAS